MAFCPKCRSEYREGVESCRTCGAALVNELRPVPKGPGVILAGVRRFFARFSGSDMTAPRLQSFLLEQTPDWRHTLLAVLLVIAMTQVGIGKTAFLRAIFAPVATGPQSLAWRAGIVPEMERISPLVVAGVLLGSVALGIAGALVARKREWLWGPLGLCVGIALEFLWMELYYPYGRTVPSRSRPGTFVTWEFHISAYGLPLMAGALVCAAAGGTLAGARLRRCSVGIVTVCIAMSAIGGFWNIVELAALAAGHTYWSARLPEHAYVLLQNTPYLLAGLWVGWVMRRWGLPWGAAVGLLPLYKTLTKWSMHGPFVPLWGRVLAPLRLARYARSEGVLNALAFYGARADYRWVAAAVGGLLGWWLWQWKARRAARPGVRAESSAGALSA